MITLRRLNGDSFTLNALMIEQIQSYPDTTITLMNGKKIVVKDDESEVIACVTKYYQKVGIHIPVEETGEGSE